MPDKFFSTGIYECSDALFLDNKFYVKEQKNDVIISLRR